MPLSFLTLTTDFGLADHYVAAMKGVIYCICPKAHIADISHEVRPFAIGQAAYLIAQCYAYYPAKTVHVAVVDPGVGSERRAILVEAASQYFVGPDNGVFSMVMAGEKHKVRRIDNERYFRQPVSHTFHGRDIFAPVGAHLAAGAAPKTVGPRIDDAVKLESGRQRVLHIDRFGNVITSLREANGAIRIAGAVVRARASHYAEVKPGKLFVIEGSGGFLEISMNGASAAQRLRCQVGDEVIVG